MKRGEVWEADVGGKAGKRPVLVMTRSNVIPYLSKVVVAEITTKSKGYPTQVIIDQQANLSKDSFVSAEALHTLPKDKLRRCLGVISPESLRSVSQATIFALDLAE